MSKRPPQDATLNIRIMHSERQRAVRLARARRVRLSDVARDALSRGMDILEKAEQAPAA